MITPGEMLDVFTRAALGEFGDDAKVWFVVDTTGLQTHIQVKRGEFKYAVERSFSIDELEHLNIPPIYLVERYVKELKEEMKKGEQGA